MRITQEADYALRIMCLLEQRGGILEAGSIAAAASVPPRFTLKILRKLSQGGLVSSRKGASGGYRISDGAGNETLRSVIELIDGPLVISKCIDGNCGCSLLGSDKSECAIHHIFQAISEDVTSKLDKITISDVSDKNVNIQSLVKKLGE